MMMMSNWNTIGYYKKPKIGGGRKLQTRKRQVGNDTREKRKAAAITTATTATQTKKKQKGGAVRGTRDV